MPIVYDSFTESVDTDLEAHTADSGHIWFSLMRTNRILAATNEVAWNALDYTIDVVDAFPTTADYSCETKIKVGANPVNLRVGPAIRIVPFPVFFSLWDFYSAGITENGLWRLEKWESGGYTELASGSISGFSTDQYYNLMVWAEGTTIKLFLDGVEKASVTDETFQAVGFPGLLLGASNGGAIDTRVSELTVDYLQGESLVQYQANTRDVFSKIIEGFNTRKVWNVDPVPLKVFSISATNAIDLEISSKNRRLYFSKELAIPLRKEYDLTQYTILELKTELDALTDVTITDIDTSLDSKSSELLMDYNLSLTANESRNVSAFTSLLWTVLKPIAWQISTLFDDLFISLKQIILIESSGKWLDLWAYLFKVTKFVGESEDALRRRIVWETIHERVNNVALEIVLEKIYPTTVVTVRDLLPFIYNDWNISKMLSSSETTTTYKNVRRTVGDKHMPFYVEIEILETGETIEGDPNLDDIIKRNITGGVDYYINFI